LEVTIHDLKKIEKYVKKHISLKKNMLLNTTSIKFKKIKRF